MIPDRFRPVLTKLNPLAFAAILGLALYFLSAPYWAIIGGLMLLVCGHEFGHFIAARLFGFAVPIFSIGIGAWPKLSVRIGATEYRITPWLLGGFVKIDPASAEFRKHAIWQRAIVLSGGIIMNVIMAFAILTATYHWQGMPVSAGVVIGEVVADSPAAKAGLQKGDQFLTIDGAKAKSARGAVTLIHNHDSAKPSADHIERSGQQLDFAIQPDQSGILGVKLADTGITYEAQSMRDSVNLAASGVYNTTGAILMAVGRLIHVVPGSIDDLHGPIGIVQGGAAAFSMGIFFYLATLASLSLSLAVMNLLPIPMLDGGHLAFLIVEKVRGRPLSDETQAKLLLIGMVLLLALFYLGSYNDFTKPIGK